MWTVRSTEHLTTHEARRKSYILARDLLLFEGGRGCMRHLRGGEADEARCHFCCCAALCLGFSVVQYIIQTTSVKTGSTLISQVPNEPQQVAYWLSNYLCKRSKDDTSDHEWSMKNSKSNAVQLHPFKIFFVHICIQLYFLANLLSLHVGFI